MNVRRLVWKEIRHRKVSVVLSILSVAAAVTVLTAELEILDRHDRNTGILVAARQAETQVRVDQLRADVARMADDLNESFRTITKKLGFNIFILPKDQNLSDFYAEGFAAKVMPEEYVTRLASSGAVTVQHLLPVLEQKVAWSEQGGRKILLTGTRGEIPIIGSAPKSPILDLVPRGKIVLGYELWKGLSLTVGTTVKLMGRDFTVVKCQPERGTKDDITAWVNLAEAQEMLNLPGKINAILALECNCAMADVAQVRAEIGKILPDTTIQETQGTALARAESRARAAEQGKQALARAEREAREAVAQAEANRAHLRKEIERFATVIVPLAIVGAAAWIALLTWVNVRQRRGEIGILRAIGVRSRQIAALFLARAVAVGLVGAVIGYAAGLLAGSAVAESPAGKAEAVVLFQPVLLAAVLLAAPLLAAAASWAPAMTAAWQDPAVVLREE